jgi:inorganic pyrophosphatase
MKIASTLAVCLALAGCSGFQAAAGAAPTHGSASVGGASDSRASQHQIGDPQTRDPMTLIGKRSFLDGYAARTPDGFVNVVVEIPAGTNQKWEVDKRDGVMRWEIKNGEPRVVKYLGYPANYGMVPRTLLPKASGGDGDPLDVLLLGPTQPRGTVTRARLLGVLKLSDGGEQDDKLIAITATGPLAGVQSIGELDARFPGITRILEIWMTNYKGPAVIVSRGYADRAAADAILDTAIKAFAGR